MTYDINSLREDLAETIRALRDKENPMPVDRAKAISDVAQTMINSAKVEIDMINALGRGRVEPTGFVGKSPGDTLDRQEGGAGQRVLSQDKPAAEKPYIGTPRVSTF
jgi:hypothetical protein